MLVWNAILSIVICPVLAIPEFVVFPEDRYDRSKCEMTDHELRLIDTAKVKRYDNPSRGVTEFWTVIADCSIGTVQLKQGVGDTFRNNIWTERCGQLHRPIFYNNSHNDLPAIASTTNADDLSNKTTSFKGPKPTRPPTVKRIVMQSDASRDLTLVSWPSGRALPHWLADKGYVYDVFGGTLGNISHPDYTYIYFIEDGIKLYHPDFAFSERERWFFAPDREEKRSFRDESVPPGYATCAASKAVGRYNGVSKVSKIVTIKSSMSLVDNIWGFAKVLDDVVAKKRQGRSVILYPRCSLKPRNFADKRQTQRQWDRLRAIIQDLIYQDVVVVTCAGDDAKFLRSRNDLDRFPGLWSSPEFPILVAGAVTDGGTFTDFSRGATSDNVIWAPGNDVECASVTASRYGVGQGTAFAAGMVAGFAGYFLNQTQGQGNVAAIMYSFIHERATRPIFPQKKPSIIWNLQDGSRNPNSPLQDVTPLNVGSSNSSNLSLNKD